MSFSFKALFAGVAITAVIIFALVGISHPDIMMPSQPAQVNQGSDQYATNTTMEKCHAINDTLPDPRCTPGAIDPVVTQDNIDSTICVPGYTKTVRPPVSITEPQKLESMKAYGFTDSPGNYEFDHLIPLELGGAPDDPKNLWPQPHSSSFTKDGIENYLHDQVCSGNLDLKSAQHEIATNWFSYWLRVKN